VCGVQGTGHCARFVALNGHHCHITVDVVASVFDVWIITVLGTYVLLTYLFAFGRLFFLLKNSAVDFSIKLID